ENIDKIGVGNDALTPVRQALLDRAHKNDFPVFVDTDGKYNEISGTESIATESIASIAKRENRLGSDFPNPADYYRWLVTRIESQYRQVDPWLYAVKPDVHNTVTNIKTLLTPAWIDGNDRDPFGSRPP